MNNYILKNIQHTLGSTPISILEYDNDDIECIILGGYVSNITNFDELNLAEATDYLTIKLFNNNTNEDVFIYNEIPIKPNTTFPINKIHFNNYNQLIVNSTYENNLHLSLSYIKIYNYNYGVIRTIFKPDIILDLNPSWNIVDSDNNYYNKEYIKLDKGLYNIEFETILGWERPDSVEIKNPQLRTTEIIANYTLTDSIISFYTEQVELKETFQYKLIDSDIWIPNNQIIVLPPGIYVFEFIDIENYIKPQNILLSTKEKDNIFKKVTYKKQKQSVTVDLTPSTYKLANKVKAYNRWRVKYYNNNYSPWYNSNQSVYFDILDNYTLEVENNEEYSSTTNNIEFNLTIDAAITFNIDMVPNV